MKKNKPQTPGGVPLEESIGSSLKLPLGREGAFKAWWGQLNARLVDQLAICMVDTQASSDYLSTARLLRRSRHTCYIYNHTCSTTTVGERATTPPKQGLTEGKSLSTNLSTTAANHSSSSAAADQWGSTGNNSRRWVKTRKPTQWKAAWGWCSAHGSVQPKESGASTPASQLLTQKPFLTVIPLMLLYQRDGLCKGRLKKTSSGQEKKKIK